MGRRLRVGCNLDRISYYRRICGPYVLRSEVALDIQPYEANAITAWVAPTVDGAVLAWLAEKSALSHSAKTRADYEATIADFRAMLARARPPLDLDTDPRAITLAAQAWSDLPKKIYAKSTGRVARTVPIKPASHNRRLAVLSSFYEFCIKRDYLNISANPIQKVARAKLQQYQGAHAKTPEQVKAALASIDRSTLKGLRDYAILALAVYTGRRVSELANLRYEDIQGDSDKLIITWPRVKGGKLMQDWLPEELSAALSEYIYEADKYRDDNNLSGLHVDSIWLSFRPGHTAMGIQAIQNLCQRYLGSSKAHITRHSFVAGMVEANAPVTLIQSKLGHANLATTSAYVEALNRANNAKGNELIKLFGIAPR